MLIFLKAMADLFEAVFGAVLVDSGFDIKKTFEILAPIMTDVLAVVSPDMPKDPTTELMIWSARNGCTACKFQLSANEESGPLIPIYDKPNFTGRGKVNQTIQTANSTVCLF